MALSMLELNPLRSYQHREATLALQVKNCVRVIDMVANQLPPYNRLVLG
jgi:hypothetical protein